VEWSPLLVVWLIGAVALPTGVVAGLSAFLNNWSAFLAYVILAAVGVPMALISLSAGGRTLDEAPGPPEA
jgi:hypothetical protein